jgi:hypothetical protein
MIPKYNKETFSGITQIMTPRKIDGSPGSDLYTWKDSETEMIPATALSGAFKYFPWSTETASGIYGQFTVWGETPGFQENGLAKSADVITSIIDSIRLTYT